MTRESSLRPRGNRSYSMAEHGNSEQGGFQGNYLLKPSAPATTWSPSYSEGSTIIRIFPARDPDNPQAWDPYRLGLGNNEFGDWIRRYPAVRRMGDPSATFISHDPSNDAVDVSSELTPGWVLFRAIEKAINQGQEQQGWAAMMKGGKNRGALLSKPSEVYLVQCCILHHGTKSYMPPRGLAPEAKLHVMELGTSAGLALLSKLNQIKQGFQGSDASDWEAAMVHGDPISLDYGRFIQFFKAGRDPDAAQGAATSDGWNVAQQQAAAGGNQKEDIGYDCHIKTSVPGFASANIRPLEQLVAAKVLPWEQILNFPTLEQQAHMLAERFRPDMILYAFRDHEDWIPESVRRKSVAAVSVPSAGMPGMLPPTQEQLAGTQPGYSGLPANLGWGMTGQAAVGPTANAGYAQQPVPGTPPPAAYVPPVAAPAGFVPPPQQMAPPVQQYAPQGQSAPLPQQQQLPYTPPAQPPVQPVQPQQPVANPAMNWGVNPNPVATPPAGPVTDPALPTGGIPATPPGAVLPTQQVAPSAPTPPTGFAPPTGVGTPVRQTAAAAALERARSMMAGQPAVQNPVAPGG